MPHSASSPGKYGPVGFNTNWIISPIPPQTKPITGPKRQPAATFAINDTEIRNESVICIDKNIANTV